MEINTAVEANEVTHSAPTEQLSSFNIQVASKLTGINPHTIRAWEKRYQAIVPERDSKGRRVYNEQEIERLALLNELVVNGHSISNIAKLEVTELDELYFSLKKKNFEFSELTEQDIDASFDIEECLQNLNLALLTQSLNIVSHELSKARKGLNPYTFVQKVASPFIEKIREMKLQNNMGLFELEAIFSIMKIQLEKKAQDGSEPYDDEVDYLVLSPEGLLNEIGALSTSLILKSQGVNYQYLATGRSPEAVSLVANQFKAKKIIVSSGYSVKTANANNCQAYFRKLQELLGQQLEIMLIGPKCCQDMKLRRFEGFQEFNEFLTSEKKPSVELPNNA
ncbi:MAG: MerR family transcriptional regulator [Bacteriovoracaceae bacterium]